MTVDEAIKHAEEVAEEKEIDAENQDPLFPNDIEECKKCAEEHRQLAEWLEQLQKIQEIIKSWKNGTIEEKDSVYAFHKICEVVESEEL